jgi:transposase InsO family protein
MPWKTMDVREQRVQFVVAAARGEKSFSALCREFGVTRPTGYVWLRRYQQAGLAGIAERSRRPQRSPRVTASGIQQRVIGLRQQYPDWGARKLRELLEAEGICLPRSTVHRILLRHNLVAGADRQEQALKRFERARPNELWQMDFKSPKGWNAPIGPLSVLDDHSRYVILLQMTGSTRAELVREQLETAFTSNGVPEGMLMDHGIPWWSATAATGATELSVWLMKQGIQLHWSGIRHPQTQGKVERFHGELERALRRRGWQGKPRQLWLDEFRWEHNQVRPHEALGMRTPASVWEPSLRRYELQPRWEYAAGAHVRRLDGDGKLNAYGRNWNIAQSLRREWVQLVRLQERVLVYYCRTLIRELDLATQHSTSVERWIATENPNQEP